LLVQVTFIKGGERMKVVVSDQKTGKAYMASPEQEMFVGKKMGEIIKLDDLGLPGYEGKITGGSDKDGFPMNQSIVGPARKRILTTNAAGFKASRKGERKRVSVRGNTVSKDIAQLNVVITKVGSVDVSVVLAKKLAEGDDALSAKERLIKKSLEVAGSAELGSGVKKAKH
jgi:small subunit ribosomal protein S6e